MDAYLRFITLSGEATKSKLLCLPSEKALTLKRNNLLLLGDFDQTSLFAHDEGTFSDICGSYYFSTAIAEVTFG